MFKMFLPIYNHDMDTKILREIKISSRIEKFCQNNKIVLKKWLY